MAKVLRWKGEFPDIDGNQYTVKIYGESTGVAVKSITLGANPLITEEDDNDDLFTPIRTQTGTLEVLDPDGTLMEEMLPANSLDHPVIVKKGSVVMWQGYIKNEDMDNDFTIRMNVISFTLIDILEASKSQRITRSALDAIIPGESIIPANMLLALFAQSVSHVTINDSYVDEDDAPHWTSLENIPYLDTSVLFQVEEVVNTGGVESYTIIGDTYYNIMEAIASLFGWIVRIKGTTLYISRANGNGNYIGKPKTNVQLTDLVYRSTDHRKCINKPVGKIVVECDAEEAKLELNMPTVKDGTAMVITEHNVADTDDKDDVFMLPHVNMPTNDQIVGMYQYKATGMNIKNRSINNPQSYFFDSSQQFSFDHGSTARSLYRDFVNNSTTTRSFYAFSRMAFLGEDVQHDQGLNLGFRNQATEGIYCQFFTLPQTSDFPYNIMNYPLLSIRNLKPVLVKAGAYNLSIDLKSIGIRNLDAGKYAAKLGLNTAGIYLHMSLRVGNKYWTGRMASTASSPAWVDSPRVFSKALDADGKFVHDVVPGYPDDPQVPIIVKNNMYGDIKLTIYASLAQTTLPDVVGHKDYITSMLIRSINLELVDMSVGKKRTRNTYTRILSLDESEEISQSLSYCTINGNYNSGHLLMDATAEHNFVTELQYSDGARRPEVDLMNRMERFYRVPTRILTVDVEPLSKPLPEVAIYDGTRRYTPVAESRDWFNNISTIKLIETV